MIPVDIGAGARKYAFQLAAGAGRPFTVSRKRWNVPVNSLRPDGEIAVAKEDVAHAGEIDLGADDAVGLLGPASEIDFTGQPDFEPSVDRSIRSSIDLAIDDAERRAHVRAHGHVVLDGDGSVCEPRLAAILGRRPCHDHVQVAADDAPGSAVIGMRKLSGWRGHTAAWWSRKPRPPFTGKPREVVTAVGKRLDEHPPISHFDGVEYTTLRSKSVLQGTETLMRCAEERARPRCQPFDDDVLDHETPEPQVDGQPTDMHRPAHELRRSRFSAPSVTARDRSKRS